MQTGSHLNSLDVQSPAHVDKRACKVINRKYCKLPIRCKKHRTSSPSAVMQLETWQCDMQCFYYKVKILDGRPSSPDSVCLQ